MAGIGFQLKRLFEREGLFNRIQAVSYASLVTIGPMLCCIGAVAVILWLLTAGRAPYMSRELFQAGVAYAFAFSYVVTSPVAMLLTRSVSDKLYSKQFGELLPAFYSYLRLTLAIACVPAACFLFFAHITFAEKIALYVLYIELTVIWIEVVYVSAMKAYRRIATAFGAGMAAAVAAVWLIVRFVPETATAAVLFAVMAGGFFITKMMLLAEIERFFRTPNPSRRFRFRADLRRYPSLFAIGLFVGLSMFEHQFAQWIFNGVWVRDTFRLLPEYDVAVYYAVISVFPTLIWFVVSVETNFYPKFRQYYDSVLGNGSIADIDRSRKEMERVLIGELSGLMGIQFVFSIVAIAAGIRYLPYIGFTSVQLDTFNILVMAFYAYVMLSVVLLLLLYFDDRIGALVLASCFLAANIAASWLLRDEQYMGLSLFAAALPVLAAAIGRLVYRMRRLHYVTFSAQPLYSRESQHGEEKGANR